MTKYYRLGPDQCGLSGEVRVIEPYLHVALELLRGTSPGVFELGLKEVRRPYIGWECESHPVPDVIYRERHLVRVPFIPNRASLS